jgi:hypothetical protein
LAFANPVEKSRTVEQKKAQSGWEAVMAGRSTVGGKPMAGTGSATLVKRVFSMALVWMVFGIVIGADRYFDGAGLIEVAANVVAGILVMPFIGALLGLIGGQWKEAVLGGVIGLATGALGGALDGGNDVLLKAHVCLLTGAMVGATFLGLFRRIWNIQRTSYTIMPAGQ